MHWIGGKRLLHSDCSCIVHTLQQIAANCMGFSFLPLLALCCPKYFLKDPVKISRSTSIDLDPWPSQQKILLCYMHEKI